MAKEALGVDLIKKYAKINYPRNSGLLDLLGIFNA